MRKGVTRPGQTPGESRVTFRSCAALAVLTALCSAGGAQGQPASVGARTGPRETCTPLTQARADASAGRPNVRHDGTPLPGVQPPDISKGFLGIPRSAQPKLTASQRRILECSYRLTEANADMPYALFVPSTYNPKTPAPLVVDLHGYDITPLQQILFDGTTDFAERGGFIVLAPMGYSVTAGWGLRFGPLAASGSSTPGGGKYSVSELSELDAMTVLARIRQQYTIDPDRIYLMGHSMGGGGTYHLGAKYKDIWAGLAPIAGLGGIADATAAAAYSSIPTLVLHGEKDSILPAGISRRSVLALQAVGAPHIYLEVPGADHEFWIRRGARNMEKVFLFFSMVSKRTNVGHITLEMAPNMPAPTGAPPPVQR
jgi:pimeloyl-ACP methyl ester carboxylesterase